MHVQATRVLLLFVASKAIAFETQTELSAGRDFLYLSSEARTDLLDGHAALAGGVEVVSDWRAARAGLSASAEAVGERWAAGVSGGWAPRQAGRGWIWVEPRGSGRLERDRWSAEGELGLKLRRADVGTGRRLTARVESIDQIQLRAEGHLTARDWRVEVRALYSFYDPDLARLGPSIDAGLLISVAGHPERWAAGLAGGRAIGARFRASVGLGAVAYADQPGLALLPSVQLIAGPFAGLRVRGSCELAVPATGPVRDALRPVGGLALEYER
jgi:hypothetical protein